MVEFHFRIDFAALSAVRQERDHEQPSPHADHQLNLKGILKGGKRALDPIFIVGAPRSGTTYLAELLNRHSNVFIFNETTYYDFLLLEGIGKELSAKQIVRVLDHLIERASVRTNEDENLRRLFTLFSPSEQKNLGSALRRNIPVFMRKPLRSALLEYFMATAADIKGKKRWGDKTPSHSFHLKEILADFPSAKVIHVVRDPRNFLNSYKNAWRLGGRRLRILYHPIITSFLWRRTVTAIERQTRSHALSALTIRYEDLLKFPGPTLRAVLSFIGERHENLVGRKVGKNTSFPRKRTDLKCWEKEVCELVCGVPMRTYGYEKSKDSYLAPLALICSILWLPVWALRAGPYFARKYGSKLLSYCLRRIG